jgi:hypothetical protein
MQQEAVGKKILSSLFCKAQYIAWFSGIFNISYFFNF